MFFNSLEFAIFLPIVFVLYWLITAKKLKAQNTLLLIASYIFYGWWDWKFLILIMISSATDFIVGHFLYKTEKKHYRKLLLTTSILINIGILGTFKYFNFFVDSFISLMHSLNITLNFNTLHIILPVGISFYTFQTLSYTIDIYKKKLEPTKNPIAFFTFVAFFPQLVAGPIERARDLLPQFEKKRIFDHQKAKDGMRQILGGLFKKVVIADTLATFADTIFANYSTLSGNILLLGALYFAIQIYCDFSGYSDIAIGVGRLFGFNLSKNFAFPYFSRNIQEFWRRWHITLSNWFKDYVYIPLGGSWNGKANQVRNILITFTVCGLWHGANWTFVLWGFLQGTFYIPLILFNGKNYKNTAKIWELPKILMTFFAVLISWIFFRVDTLKDALIYIKNTFSSGLFSYPDLAIIEKINSSISIKTSIVLIIGLIVVEWIQRHKEHILQIGNLPIFIRWPIYYALAFAVIRLIGEPQAFIYFQF